MRILLDVFLVFQANWLIAKTSQENSELGFEYINSKRAAQVDFKLYLRLTKVKIISLKKWKLLFEPKPKFLLNE